MNEAAAVATQTAEPLAPITEADLAPEGPKSIADHAAQFGPQATKDESEEPAEPLKPIRPVDQQKRDQGKFTEGRKPMRSKDAVERINQLTNRAKTAEEKLTAAEAELARLRTQHAAPQQIRQAEQKVERAEQATQEPRRQAPTEDPEPQEADAKYGGDYGKYLVDHARWAARDEYRQIQDRQRQADEQRRIEDSHRQTLTSWSSRVTAAKGKYADFERVAFAPTKIPAGSAIDAFIMEDDNGPDVLYHLNHSDHAQEMDELLTLSPVQQLKRLALLSQRFSSTPPNQAGPTGSADGRQSIKLPPRPPNPVRTEAQRASGGPPPTDGTLSIAEHTKQFGPKTRSR